MATPKIEARLFKHGGPDAFRIVETKPDEMRPDGLRIQVGACGVNFADIMMRQGLYPEAPKLPFAPGYEVAGTITEVGDQVTAYKIGDRVVAGCLFGGYSSEIVVPEFQGRKTPAHLSDVEAAAIPVNFITAWVALHELARVRKGDRVLIQSAAGGVGVAATQIAANAGAIVTGLVGSAAKLELVRELGAAAVFLTPEFEKLSPFEAGGFEAILDSQGGKTLKESYRKLAPGGRVVTFGMSDMIGARRNWFRAVSQLIRTPFFHTFRLMMDTKGVFGLNVLQLFEPSLGGPMRRCFDEIIREFESKRLRVVIGKTFPLQEVGAAHLHLQSRANVGKVVLIP